MREFFHGFSNREFRCELLREFLRDFFHWFSDRGFRCEFLNGFSAWIFGVGILALWISPWIYPWIFFFTHCVDSLFKVQSWPVLVAVDFDVDFHRGFFYTQITRFYNDFSTNKIHLSFSQRFSRLSK